MLRFALYIFFLGIFMAVSSQPVQADEVLKTVEEAVSQYNNGDFNGAASNLDYSAQLIRQKKSEALKEVFPEQLAEWKAAPATSQATRTTAFGRSISVSRTYEKNSSVITIEISSDSPVMQSLQMMLNNPVIAGAGGAKLETFSDHKGIVQYSEKDRNGEVNIVVAERFMVTVKGQDVSREDMLAYAQAVKYADLAKNGKVKAESK